MFRLKLTCFSFFGNRHRPLHKFPCHFLRSTISRDCAGPKRRGHKRALRVLPRRVRVLHIRKLVKYELAASCPLSEDSSRRPDFGRPCSRMPDVLHLRLLKADLAWPQTRQRRRRPAMPAGEA